MLQNHINSFSEQINTCLPFYMQMVQLTTNNGGMCKILLKNNTLIISINYGIEPNNYLNYYNEIAI